MSLNYFNYILYLIYLKIYNTLLHLLNNTLKYYEDIGLWRSRLDW